MTETSLVDRFGSEGRRAWHLSRGMDDSPVIPLVHVETVVECTSLPFSSASLELLITVVDTLLARAFSRPSMRVGTRAKVSWSALWKEVRPGPGKLPLRGCWQPEASLIDNQAPAGRGAPVGPVEDVSLTLDDLTGESGAQLGLLPEARESNKRRLVEVDRELRARTGGSPALYRVVGLRPGTQPRRCGPCGFPSTHRQEMRSGLCRAPSRSSCGRVGTVNPRPCAWGAAGERYPVSRSSGASTCGGCPGP